MLNSLIAAMLHKKKTVQCNTGEQRRNDIDGCSLVDIYKPTPFSFRIDRSSSLLRNVKPIPLLFLSALYSEESC